MQLNLIQMPSALNSYKELVLSTNLNAVLHEHVINHITLTLILRTYESFKMKALAILVPNVNFNLNSLILY